MLLAYLFSSTTKTLGRERGMHGRRRSANSDVERPALHAVVARAWLSRSHSQAIVPRHILRVDCGGGEWSCWVRRYVFPSPPDRSLLRQLRPIVTAADSGKCRSHSLPQSVTEELESMRRRE